MISNKILNEAVRRLVEKFHPEKIILFGSQARGTADEHSGNPANRGRDNGQI